jgi:hypothetical protein
MRTAALLAVIWLSASPKDWGTHGEVVGLSIRGRGCHVELLGPDGGAVCTGIATPIRRCSSFTVFRDPGDGGMVGEKSFLGSTCPTPHLSSYAMGNGTFFVEQNGTMYSLVCDDSSKCQRNSKSADILKCCREESSIRGSALCNVTPHSGVCVDTTTGE